jgi:2-octaprenyl-6-methoxyphenol hydroxylase
VVLVGNAAHGLHPIAGQGLNLSLRDCAALAETIADDTPLDAWVAARRADQRRVASFTDRLNSLFLAELPLAGALRGAGLAAFGLCGPLRRVFTAYGAGVHPPVPRLIRGVPLR